MNDREVSMIQIKRVYEGPQRSDGQRVLVDRLWPRGMKKSELIFSKWPKEITPSSEIRKSFAHKKENFSEFKKKYKKELHRKEAKEEIHELAKRAKEGTVTLLYGAKDEKINHAVVLKEVIEKEIERL